VDLLLVSTSNRGYANIKSVIWHPVSTRTYTSDSVPVWFTICLCCTRL